MTAAVQDTFDDVMHAIAEHGSPVWRLLTPVPPEAVQQS